MNLQQIKRVFCLHGKLTISLFIISILSSNIYCAYLTVPIDGRSAGMANASITIDDTWSNFRNQAGLAHIENTSAGFLYENRFGLYQVSTKALAIAIPVNSGCFGLNYSYFGYSAYNESKAGIGFGKKLADFLRFGIQLNYMHTYISENYGNRGKVTFETGILATPVQHFTVGFHVFNPLHTYISNNINEHIPTIIRAGIGYEFNKTTRLTIETQKDIDQKPVFKFGGEHLLFDFLYIRTGIMHNPVKYSFGLGIEYKGFYGDIGFISHPELGYSPHLSIYYRFSSNENEQE
jgi:hypothetical protein